MKPKRTFDLARWEWDQYHGNSEKCTLLRAQMATRFKEMFPQGHNANMAPAVTKLAEEAKVGKTFHGNMSGLNMIHPRAWDLILKFGKNQKPSSYLKHDPHLCDLQPMDNCCFDNALKVIRINRHIADDSKATYVEGISFSPTSGTMLHAWVGSGYSRKCADWTLYASTQWTRYFGISFSLEDYERIVCTAKTEVPMCQLLFKRESFPVFENLLWEILEKRPQQYRRK